MNRLIDYRDVRLDDARMRVFHGSLTVPLSRTETNLLALLLQASGEPVERSRILDEVWGADSDVAPSVVDTFVSYLRRKLDLIGRRGLIRTVRGVGYAVET